MSVLVVSESPDHAKLLDARLHDVGWGLLLILTGAIWLLPAERVPDGTWLLGVAAILLGTNAVRYAARIPLCGLSLFLGVVALAAGLGRLWQLEPPLLSICLILIGAGLLARPFVVRSPS